MSYEPWSNSEVISDALPSEEGDVELASHPIALVALAIHNLIYETGVCRSEQGVKCGIE